MNAHRMIGRQRWTAAALLIALLPAGVGLVRPTPAQAGPKGRRTTTAVLGAATAYFLIQGQKKAALGFGAGTLVSYLSYRRARERQLRRRAIRHHRHRGWRRACRR